MHPQEQLPSMQGRTGASKKNVILEFGGWNIVSSMILRGRGNWLMIG